MATIGGKVMLEARGLSKHFGALAVTNGVSLRLAAGERHAIIGPNGAGKTTLFNLLSGELAPDVGSVIIDGTDVGRLPPDARARFGMSRSFQKNNLFAGLSVRENLGLAAMVGLGLSRCFWRSPMRDAEVVRRIEVAAGWVNLEGLLEADTGDLSYGARRQLEVGLALAERPKVLLLDEPTSGMSPEETVAMLDMLKELPGNLTMLIIEHDMDLVYGIAERITVLNYGEVVYEGTPEEVRASGEVRQIYLGDWADRDA